MELLKIKNKLFDLKSPKIMGIINISKDSYYKNSIKDNLKYFLNKIESHLKEGADIIDVGSLSSNPKSQLISQNDELTLLKPFILEIEKLFPSIILSVDTFNSETARFALDHGASIINDISGFQFDDKLLDVLIEHKPCYILMHNGENFQVMHQKKEYQSVLMECFSYFTKKLNILKEKDILDVIIDPGFGFSKDLNQNYEALSSLEELKLLNRPILVGISRKSMIYKFLEIDCETALNGTSVLHTISLIKGAKILRVHDVSPAKETIKLLDKLNLI